MKALQSWSVVIGFVISILVLAGYAYNVSAYSAVLGEKVRAQESDLKYIRDRVDAIYNRLPCAQCKEEK